MGIRHLDNFTRHNVPNGILPVKIEDAIRQYYDSNQVAPIIVVDLISLYVPLSNYDKEGLMFGGRFNMARFVVEQFFDKLRNAGAQLEFFTDGPVQESKTVTWCKRQDERYMKTLSLFDAVERGSDLSTLMREFSAPMNFCYPLRCIAKKYGNYTIALGRECDQELVAHAVKLKALAIIADDTDFLIYEGSWRYWSSRDLDFSTLATVEYNRAALLTHLGLRRDQMPLFATLGGNDIMPYDDIKKLHSELGPAHWKFPNLARFIRSGTFGRAQIVSLLQRTTGKHNVEEQVRLFQESLDTYKVNFHMQNLNLTGDDTLAVLVKRDSSFLYMIWKEKRLDISIGVLDLRQTDFSFADLLTRLILRMISIVRFHRTPRLSHYALIIKRDHDDEHQERKFCLEYPQGIEPPTLLQLLTNDRATQERLLDVKYRLLAWIASDTLQPVKLRLIPENLQLTVYTLYYLVEKKVLKLFEADLLLQVANDVVNKTYDMFTIAYPRMLESRPFKLSFLYQKVYSYTAKAFLMVGLDDDHFWHEPPFDGVLFHKRYQEWSKGLYSLEHIRMWRIYAA